MRHRAWRVTNTPLHVTQLYLGMGPFSEIGKKFEDLDEVAHYANSAIFVTGS